MRVVFVPNTNGAHGEAGGFSSGRLSGVSETDGRYLDPISSHIERHLGPIDNVLHEIVSDVVHIDLHHVRPTAERPSLAARSFETDCAGCHASQTELRIDLLAGHMAAHWTEASIGCEACHGAGGAHSAAWTKLEAGKPLPRLERQYFLFGEPIDTTRFAGRHDDGEACQALRDEVKTAIESQIAQLRELREADPERYPIQRMLRRLSRRLR